MASPTITTTKIVQQPTVGGGHKTARVKVQTAPTPVQIVRQPRSRFAGARVTRLGTPTAFLMLAGLALIYYALHGWDQKYNAFNGAFTGKQNPAAAQTTTGGTTK